MFKSALKSLAVLACAFLCGVMGWIGGAYLGGNFAENFTFNGVRGYEATGQLGFWAGIMIGLALSIFLLFKRSKGKIL